MAAIHSFRDLEVYKSAREQARRLFVLTKRFPREETYSLIDQVRRSSRAVGAILAEGWALRRYEAAFVNKIYQALGEANETQSWLDSALDCGYITDQEHDEFDSQWQRIGGMLRKMSEKAETFVLRDDARE